MNFKLNVVQISFIITKISNEGVKIFMLEFI